MTTIFCRVRSLLAALGTFSLLVAFGSGCSPKTSITPSPTVKSAETGVKTDFPKKKNLRRVIEQPASIEAFEETPVVSRISGYVEKVPADIGRNVEGPRYDAKGLLSKPGDVLAELSVPEMLRELEQKQALVKQACAEVDQSIAALDAAAAFILTAEAQVREAESARVRAVANHDYWKIQYARVADAVAKGVLEKQTGDETLNKHKAAKAYREEIEARVQSAQAMAKESEAKRNKANADVKAARARVLVAQAEEGRFAALAEYRFIRAPFDGVVTRRNIHTGHFLQPGSGAGPNILFIVARTDTLRISADIPEAEASHITKGLTAKIQPPILKDQTFEGKVTRTSWTLDTKSRTLRIEIDYPNKEGKLRPGMYANVTFIVALEGRWTLPASAIFTHADQACCWRVENGKAVRTPLKLGVRDGKDIEVLKMQTRPPEWEAVAGAEEIVVANLGAISEGKEIPAKQK